jgi:hypothetical protein
MNRTDAPPVMDGDGLRKAVEWAIMSRRSIRPFLSTPVPRATVESILDVARFAASGINTRPWRVPVVTGASEMFVVGMSLGFADHSSIENELVTERAEVGSFTTFYAD